MRVSLLFALGVVLFISFQENESSKTSLRVLGNWDNPPAYHGNPLAPGGVGAALEFIYCKLAIYNIITDEFTNYMAESFEDTPEKLTVKIKDGIFWDDGTPFSSRDVKTNFIVNGGISGWQHVWDGIESIETPDDLTVVFNYNDDASPIVSNYILTEFERLPEHIYGKWEEPSMELIKLRREQAKIAKLKKEEKPYDEDKLEALDDTFDEKYREFKEELYNYKPEYPMGYGPYKVSNVSPSHMTLDKVEKFPGIENNTVDQVIITKGTGNEMTWSEFKVGNLDIGQSPLSQDVAKSMLDSNPNLEIVISSYFDVIGLFLNTTKYPFNDLRFRKAIAYIIDRDQVREIASYYDTTMKYISTVIPSIQDSWLDYDQLETYDLDLQKAESLLKDMGMKRNSNGIWCGKDGKELSFMIKTQVGSTDHTIAADEISRMLTKFGIPTGQLVLKGELLKEQQQKGEV